MKIFNAKYCYGWILILTALCIQLLSPLHIVFDDHNHADESSEMVDHCSACTVVQQLQNAVFYGADQPVSCLPILEFITVEAPIQVLNSTVDFPGFNFLNKAPPYSI